MVWSAPAAFYKRESFPGYASGSQGFDGLDAFNTSSNEPKQQLVAARGRCRQIYQHRHLGRAYSGHGTQHPSQLWPATSGQHFFNHVNEKLRILGEIPLRKFDANGQPILDPEGNPDTSFLAKIPADTPFTFQTLDRNGLVLNMAQTWHQVRPGEMRADCGGCHAHSQQPLGLCTDRRRPTGLSSVGFDSRVRRC